MADDVSSFFKSKKSKKHGSGKAIQTPDDLAKRLERTVQQQQVFDRENGIEENEEEVEQQRERPSYVKQFSGGGGGGGSGVAGGEQQNNDESEWLDYQDTQEVDLAKIGIKEMELREESEDEANEDEETLSNRKTWNMPGQPEQKNPQKGKKVTYAAGMDVDDGEEGANAEEKPEATTKSNETEKPQQEESEASKSEADKEEGGEKKSVYVPPSLRRNQLVAASRPTSNMKQPNIEDSMEFPSLAAAGELAAEIEKTKKKKPPQFQPMKKGASSAPAHAHAPSPAPAEETHPSRPQAEPVHAALEASSEPPKSAYVPPHLRKRGGAS